jgi:hypothetical protein
MNSERRMHAALLILWLSLFPGIPVSGSDRTYNADVARVVDVAVDQFSLQLEAQYADEVADAAAAELLAYAKNPQNYDLGFSQTGDSYVVVFLPRRVPPFENTVGGGGEYHIKKSDLSVIKFVGYK